MILQISIIGDSARVSILLFLTYIHVSNLMLSILCLTDIIKRLKRLTLSQRKSGNHKEGGNEQATTGIQDLGIRK